MIIVINAWECKTMWQSWLKSEKILIYYMFNALRNFSFFASSVWFDKNGLWGNEFTIPEKQGFLFML